MVQLECSVSSLNKRTISNYVHYMYVQKKSIPYGWNIFKNNFHSFSRFGDFLSTSVAVSALDIHSRHPFKRNSIQFIFTLSMLQCVRPSMHRHRNGNQEKFIKFFCSNSNGIPKYANNLHILLVYFIFSSSEEEKKWWGVTLIMNGLHCIPFYTRMFSFSRCIALQILSIFYAREDAMLCTKC